nr:integrase, catalytic region, zinc finger, CCHC-type, peptidase aspartic, catalytic [Tanacetum cinerariifolium]
FSELKKITALLAKAFYRRKFYSKPTNNNLRTSSTSQSANKKQEFVKTDDKNVEKKADEKKRDMSKVKCYNCKKEGHFAKDCKKAKIKDYNYYKIKMLLAKKEINANMVFMAQIEKVLSETDKSSSSAEETIAEVAYYTSEFETLEYYDNSTNYGLFVNNDDDQEIFHDAIESASEIFFENHIDSQKDYDKSKVDHNDSKEKEHLVDKLIQKFNHKISKCQKHIEKVNQQSKDFENQNKDLQEKYYVLTLKFPNWKNVCVTRILKWKNVCENKLHKMGQTNQTVHMIMLSKDNLYNGRKGIGFENLSYFEKAKDLRPTLYDEKVIGLGYTLMFLTHSDEPLEIKKFKRSRENKIKFAYNYGNLNASYVNEKINFKDDYFQEIINPDFEKIYSPFQQTSSLKPYVLNVILEKIIIDLEDEVVSLLEKEKASLKTIESLKSKGFESSENEISESKNQSENDCHVVEKECDKEENSKVIAHGLFKLSVSQSVSPISMTKTSCDSKNVERCSKHMTGNRALLTNFMEKFLGTVRFGNNDFTVIAGYGDVVIG